MGKIIFYTFIIALISSFIIALMRKLGFVEYMQIHGRNKFLSELFSCDFCLSWWTNVCVTIIMCVTCTDYSIIFIPFLSTMITRKLL